MTTPHPCPHDGNEMTDTGYSWRCYKCGYSISKSKLSKEKLKTDCDHKTARCDCINPGQADYKAYLRGAGMRVRDKDKY